MANLIIKPASASDDLKLQDGAGADIVTVDTNNVLFGKGIQETKGTSTNSSAAITIDLATGNFFEIDLENNNATVTSWTFSNMAGNNKVSSWIIKFTQGSTARALTYPAAVKWSAGYDHVMSTANNAVDIVSMFTFNNGTDIYANVVGRGFA